MSTPFPPVFADANNDSKQCPLNFKLFPVYLPVGKQIGETSINKFCDCSRVSVSEWLIKRFEQLVAMVLIFVY